MKQYIYIIYLFLFISATGYSQTTIKGKVTDDKANPIPGVTIQLVKQSKITVSDFDGLFSVEVKKGDVVRFSSIGFVTKNVEIKDQKELNIILKTDIAQLDEIVIIGYGSSSKKDVTGAISTVKLKDIETAPVATFDQALSGRIAGVTVSADDGTPGSSLRITVRGGNSVTGSNEPLYVVNGIPLEEFDPGTINTSDIASFQVLKDASATAIYGSRGANGVVVITTKKGSTTGKTTVNVNFSSSVQSIINYLPVLNPYQFVKSLETRSLAFDGFQYLPNDPSSSLYQFLNIWGDPELYRNEKGTDYQKEAFRNAMLNTGNFSISGGNKKTNIFFSAGFVDQEGILINTGYNRKNLNFTLRHSLSDKIKFQGSTWFTHSERTGPPVRTDSQSSEIRNIIQFRPIRPLLNRDENSLFDDGGFPGDDPNEFLNLFNPLENLLNTERLQEDYSIRFHLKLDYEINKNFTLTTANGYNANISKNNLFYGLRTSQGSRSENGINGSIEDETRTTFNISNTLKFNKKIKKIKVNAILGTEYVENDRFTSRLSNANLPTDDFGINNLGIGLNPSVASNKTKNTLLSFFGRTFINIDKKYLLTATFRADGSSKFQPAQRWGYFPSFSGVWRLSNESFMDNVGFVNNLSLRAGWGVTGNNRIGDFNSFNQFGLFDFSSYAFGTNETFQTGGIQNVLAVPDLRWESTAQTNIGLDFSLFNSRLSGTMNYYYKKTDDLLLFADMSLSTGFPVVVQNIGSISNQGFEFSLTGRIIDKKDFSWETDFNISTNRNKVLALNDGQQFIKTTAQQIINNSGEQHYISQIGQPVGQMYGLVYDGLYQVDDFTFDPNANPISPYSLKDGLPTYRSGDLGPGAVKYKDLNNDGFIDEKDRTVIGNPNPDHFGGLNNRFTYKNFSFEFLMQWSYGGDVFNATKSNFGYVESTYGSRNYLANTADTWTPWNTDTDVAAYYTNGEVGFPPDGYKLDTRYIEDGSFLRLKTVNFSYNLPLKENKLGLSNLKFVVSGQNLLTWTNYSGFDPEVSITRNALTPNLDFSAYPQNKIYNISISARF
jgi:TonB-dependent starch-binding outer membrane protein SusC